MCWRELVWSPFAGDTALGLKQDVSSSEVLGKMSLSAKLKAKILKSTSLVEDSCALVDAFDEAPRASRVAKLAHEVSAAHADRRDDFAALRDDLVAIRNDFVHARVSVDNEVEISRRRHDFACTL